MSDIEVLEIEVDETDFTDEPENCVTSSWSQRPSDFTHRFHTSTRDTYEPLGDHIQRRHKVEVQTAQTLEVPEKKKRESGAQRRKRKRAEQIAEEGLRDTLCC